MLAVVGLAAATCSPALAESGAPDVPLPAVPDLAAAAATVLEDATLQEVLPEAAAACLPELEPVAVAAPQTTLPAVPAQQTAAEPVRGAVTAPPPRPVPAQAAAPEPDPPAPDAPPAAVEQSAPTNINVSVRVDSPGDNGSVDQVNAADATMTVEGRYQPDDPQYQAPAPAETASAAAATAETPDSDAASAWDWTWSWNCADPVPKLPAAPNGSVQNWVWNWDWDCGVPELPAGNSSGQSGGQYQPAVTQYRPININISIRTNSPGNDGPVRQGNLATAASTVVMPTIHVEVPGASPSGPWPAPASAPAVVVSASLPAPEALQAAMPAPLLAFVFGEEPDPAAQCCPPEGPIGAPTGVAGAPDAAPGPGPDAAPRDITAPARFRAAVEVTLRLTRASEAAARKARSASKPARTVRPARSPHRGDGTREPAAVLSSGFAPPLNASDGRYGYLVLLVAGIAVVFAFADATRSVAAEVRATGEDPDPPPDRPG